MSEAPKKLVAKLCEVMKAITNIPKGGHNSAQNYDFVRDVDVLDTVRAELAKRNVFLTNHGEETARGSYQTKSGATMHSASVRLEFIAHDGDTGESLPLGVGLGEAADSGDKAVYKAMTGAAKYGLLKAFLVPTMDDPESDEEVDRATSGAPSKLPTPARTGYKPGDVAKAYDAGTLNHEPRSQPPSRQTVNAAPRQQPDDGATFPPFGSNKGQLIRGAKLKDLKWYAGAVASSVDDPDKARFIDKNRATLAALNAEIARQSGHDESDVYGQNDRPRQQQRVEADVPF